MCCLQTTSWRISRGLSWTCWILMIIVNAHFYTKPISWKLEGFLNVIESDHCKETCLTSTYLVMIRIVFVMNCIVLCLSVSWLLSTLISPPPQKRASKVFVLVLIFQASAVKHGKCRCMFMHATTCHIKMAICGQLFG